MNTTKDQNIFQCTICCQFFGSKSSLSRHSKGHEIRGKRYKCSQCPASFKNQSSFVIHQQAHNVSYTCLLCTKSFVYKANYQRHMLKIHTKNPPKAKKGVRPCKFCGKLYIECSVYQHQNECSKNPDHKRVACADCDFTAARKGVLDRHVQRKHSKESFKC